MYGHCLLLNNHFGVEAGCQLQRSAKRLVRGCEKFVTALAYLFCLALLGSCLVRFAYLLADLCTSKIGRGLCRS